MATQSLYRKYRPQTFADLVGQEHVTRALRNAVREGTVGQGYLFSGPRGTGKTTTARILAKALNCTGPDGGGLPDDGEPCGVCPSCTEIAAGSSLDVIEIDAASTRSIDDMRDLLRRVALVGGIGRHKVYIVDEVHQLTRDASSALLKTLEEPPPHVVFVLATTDPQKVLDTIRSRTQHYEFSLLPVDQLVGLLADVLAREGIEADEASLRLVARRGAGSARDSLSLLDQALAYGDGRLDPDAVARLFAATPTDRRLAILDAVAGEDAAAALSGVADVLAAGTDARQLADDLLHLLRDVFVTSASRGTVAVDASEEELARLRAVGEAMGASGVQRALEVVGTAVSDMARAPDARVLLEVAVVRLSRRELGTPVEVLAERVDRLERALAALGAGTAPPPPVPAPAPPPGRPAAVDPPTPAAPAPAVPAADPPVPSGPAAARRTLGALRRGAGASAPAPAAVAPVPAPEPAPAPPPPDPAPDPAPEPDVVAPAPDPAPAPAPVAAAAASDRSAGGLDEVILRWPEVIDELTGRVKAAAREAQPIAVDDGVVVLALPSTLARLREAVESNEERVAGLLAAKVGAPVTGLRVTIDDRLVGGSADGEPPPDPRPSELASVVEAPPAPEPTPPPAAAPAPAPAPAPPAAEPPPAAAPPDPTPTGRRVALPPRGAAAPAPPPPAPAAPEEEVIDPDDLVDAPADVTALDSQSQLIRLFDAEVVEEIDRGSPGA